MASHETAIEGKQLDLGKLWPVGIVVAVIGILLFLVLGPGLVGEEHRGMLWGSAMFGITFWLAITLGCLGLSLLHHAIRPAWSTALLRLLEAGGGLATLLLMAVLFGVIAAGGLHSLYEWTHQDVVQNDPILRHKSGYLSPFWWTLRLAIYFGFWVWFASVMRRSTRRQDESKNFRLEAGRQSWGAAGIVMFMVTATFAAIDLLMSMNPHWYSTMYGAWFVVGSAYGALALLVAIFCHNANKEPYRRIVHPNLTRDMGNMLFVLTMLWGYTTLSQFLIIWNGNVPETTSYFTQRMAMYPRGMEGNLWAVVGFILIIGMFFIPFYSLLAPRTKKYPSNLKRIAIWMFAMAFLNLYLIVVPSLPERAPLGPLTAFTVTDLLAWLAVGGLWLSAFGAMLKRAPLLPQYDNRLEEAKKHAH